MEEDSERSHYHKQWHSLISDAESISTAHSRQSTKPHPGEASQKTLSDSRLSSCGSSTLENCQEEAYRLREKLQQIKQALLQSSISDCPDDRVDHTPARERRKPVKEQITQTECRQQKTGVQEFRSPVAAVPERQHEISSSSGGTTQSRRTSSSRSSKGSTAILKKLIYSQEKKLLELQYSMAMISQTCLNPLMHQSPHTGFPASFPNGQQLQSPALHQTISTPPQSPVRHAPEGEPVRLGANKLKTESDRSPKKPQSKGTPQKEKCETCRTTAYPPFKNVAEKHREPLGSPLKSPSSPNGYSPYKYKALKEPKGQESGEAAHPTADPPPAALAHQQATPIGNGNHTQKVGISPSRLKQSTAIRKTVHKHSPKGEVDPVKVQSPSLDVGRPDVMYAINPFTNTPVPIAPSSIVNPQGQHLMMTTSERRDTKERRSIIAPVEVGETFVENSSSSTAVTSSHASYTTTVVSEVDVSGTQEKDDINLEVLWKFQKVLAIEQATRMQLQQTNTELHHTNAALLQENEQLKSKLQRSTPLSPHQAGSPPKGSPARSARNSSSPKTSPSQARRYSNHEEQTDPNEYSVQRHEEMFPPMPASPLSSSLQKTSSDGTEDGLELIGRPPIQYSTSLAANASGRTASPVATQWAQQFVFREKKAKAFPPHPHYVHQKQCTEHTVLPHHASPLFSKPRLRLPAPDPLPLKEEAADLIDGHIAASRAVPEGITIATPGLDVAGDKHLRRQMVARQRNDTARSQPSSPSPNNYGDVSPSTVDSIGIDGTPSTFRCRSSMSYDSRPAHTVKMKAPNQMTTMQYLANKHSNMGGYSSRYIPKKMSGDAHFTPRRSQHDPFTA